LVTKKSKLELLDLLLETGAEFAARLIHNLRNRVEYRLSGVSGVNIRERY
jgi:hypothetical protein